MKLVDEINKFNIEYREKDLATPVLNILKANEDYLEEAISDIDKWRPKFNVTELFYKLKKKFEKRFKVLDYNEGTQTFIIGNISDKTPEIADLTQTVIYIPDNISKEPLAYLVIKDYIRVPKFQDKIRRLESLLKRSKVSYTKTKARINNINTIKFQVNYLDDNERFWGTLNLLTKG